MSIYTDDHVTELLRSIETEDRQLVEPPAGVWDAIVAEAGLDSSDVASPAHVTKPERRAEDHGDVEASAVVALSDRRRRPLMWMTAVAAGVALLFGALVALNGPSTTTVSEVALSSDGLDGAPTSLVGRAELVETETGLEISVDVPEGIETDGGYLELWLIDTDVTGMVSLGPLNDSGLYAIPPGVDPGRFPVVDISVEPTDGVPTHSGRSVLRGELEA